MEELEDVVRLAGLWRVDGWREEGRDDNAVGALGC